MAVNDVPDGGQRRENQQKWTSFFLICRNLFLDNKLLNQDLPGQSEE